MNISSAILVDSDTCCSVSLCVSVCFRVYSCVYVWVCLFMSVCVCARVCVCLCVCACVCLCVCVCVCVCVYLFVHECNLFLFRRRFYLGTPANFDTNVEWCEKFFYVIGNKLSSMMFHSGNAGKEVRTMFSSLCCSFLVLFYSGNARKEVRSGDVHIKLFKHFSSSLYFFLPCVVPSILLFYWLCCSIRFLLIVLF